MARYRCGAGAVVQMVAGAGDHPGRRQHVLADPVVADQAGGDVQVGHAGLWQFIKEQDPPARRRQPVGPAADGAAVGDPGQAAEVGRIAGLQVGVDHLPAPFGVRGRNQVTTEIPEPLGDALDDLRLAEPGIAPGHRHQVVARLAAGPGSLDVLADDRAKHVREIWDVHGVRPCACRSPWRPRARSASLCG